MNYFEIMTLPLALIAVIGYTCRSWIFAITAVFAPKSKLLSELINADAMKDGSYDNDRRISFGNLNNNQCKAYCYVYQYNICILFFFNEKEKNSSRFISKKVFAKIH